MILSDAEIYKRCKWRSIPTMQDVAKIQHAETLRQLEKEGLLRHDAKIVAEQTGRGFVNLTICREDCRACAKLREVEL